MDSDFEVGSALSLAGAFWRPETPTDRFTGTLTRRGTRFLLTTSPKFSETIDISQFGSSETAERVDTLQGFTTAGPCTLFYLQSPLLAGMTDARVQKAVQFREYQVELCVMGQYLSSIDSAGLQTAEINYTGLRDWIRVSPSKIDTSDTSVVVTYPRDLPAVLDFGSLSIQSCFTLDICPKLRHSAAGLNWEQEPLIRIAPRTPQSLRWFMQVASRLENFFSLWLGASLGQRRFALHEEKQNTGWLVKRRSSKGQRIHAGSWPLCDASQTASAMASWFSLPDAFMSFENLVFGTLRQSRSFVETEFLSLAQALESFHRLTDNRTLINPAEFQIGIKNVFESIDTAFPGDQTRQRLKESLRHSNEPTFKQRIESLLSRLSSMARDTLIGDIPRFQNTLRDTRNYFTHPGIRKTKHVLTGVSELFMFNQKLHAMLRLLLLLHLGVPESCTLEPIRQQASRWE